METITITKTDLVWSYIAKFFSVANGLIVLPYMLNKLSADEIGLNYLMLSVSSLVTLLDFGFVYQFGRNFTYVYSGAQHLLKENIEEITGNYGINYRLLSTLLKTAKTVYGLLALVCFFLMITLGTVYIDLSTKGFTLVENSLYMWILFSISTGFNIYYFYYNSLLVGSGKIKENNISTILSKLVYLAVSFSLLYLGYGLFSIVIANAIAPFVQRYYCHRCYYTDELKSKLTYDIPLNEIRELFLVIWYNSKKLGLNCLGNYAIANASTFIIGVFLPLPIVASFGLLKQFVGFILNLSQIPFATYQPKLAYYKVNGKMRELKRLTIETMSAYCVCMVGGCLLFFICAPYILYAIKSNTELPAAGIIGVYIVAMLLEGNHNNCTTLITVFNKVPYVKSNILTGMAIVLLTIISLKFTEYGLFAVVIVQFVCQLCYNNWKWPLYVYKKIWSH